MIILRETHISIYTNKICEYHEMTYDDFLRLRLFLNFYNFNFRSRDDFEGVAVNKDLLRNQVFQTIRLE